MFEGVPPEFKLIAKGNAFGIPNGVLFLVLVFLAAHLILNHTRYGRQIYAFGRLEETARPFGIKVLWIKSSVYVISGMLAALAGVIGASRLGIDDPNAGVGYEPVSGALAGVLIVSILTKILQLKNVRTHAQLISWCSADRDDAFLFVARRQDLQLTIAAVKVGSPARK